MAEVELSSAGPVAIVTLNRPAKRNAISIAMQSELLAALERVAETADVRVLVLVGAGDDFCVGGDHAVVERMEAEAHFAQVAAARHRQVFSLLLGFEMPVIAAIEGRAFGFGAELAAASDIVLVGETARLADPHVPLGLPPAPVTLLAWPLMTSRLIAAELVLTGREVAASEAVALGLASRMVPAGTALTEATALAAALAAMPGGGMALAKRALRLALADLDALYPEALGANEKPRR